jgi:hypothetical protein
MAGAVTLTNIAPEEVIAEGILRNVKIDIKRLAHAK